MFKDRIWINLHQNYFELELEVRLHLLAFSTTTRLESFTKAIWLNYQVLIKQQNWYQRSSWTMSFLYLLTLIHFLACHLFFCLFQKNYLLHLVGRLLMIVVWHSYQHELGCSCTHLPLFESSNFQVGLNLLVFDP